MAGDKKSKIKKTKIKKRVGATVSEEKENLEDLLNKEVEFDIITLYKWTAPMRYFKKMNMKNYWILSVCVLLFFVALAILGQFGLIIAITSAMFLVYAIGTVPPENVDHEITNRGIFTMEERYNWKDLQNFWFSKKDEQFLLNFNTNLRLPGKVIMLVDGQDLEKIKEMLIQHIPYYVIDNQRAINRLTDGEWVDMTEEKDNEVLPV